MAIFEDSFGATAGTLLTDGGYVPTLLGGGAGSGTWARVGGAGQEFVVGASNRARVNSTGTGRLYASGTPGATQYDVEADLRTVTIPSTDTLWWGILSHQTTGATGGYSLRLETLGSDLLARLGSYNGADSYTSRAATSVGSFAASHTYHLKLTARLSGSDLVLNGYVTRDSDSFYLKSDGSWQSGEIACVTWTDTAPLATGKVGIAAFDFEGDSAGLQIDNFVGRDLALTAGTASLVDATDTAVNLSATASTGGATPYSYQWQRGTTAGTWSDLTGKTSLTCADTTAVAGTNYWYRLKTTDNASAVVYTNLTPGNLWSAPIVLGWCGDSITVTGSAGQKPPDYCVARLRLLSTMRKWTLGSNQGVSGSSTTKWLPSAPEAYLTDAKTAFAAASVTHVMIMLGTNDCLSIDANTYSSQLSTICSDLVTAGYKVVLNYPPYNTSAMSDTAEQRLFDFQAKIDALVNGTTILRGDRLAYQYFAANSSQLSDGVHPSDTGAQSLGLLWANGLDAALAGSSGGGGGAARRVIGGI